MYDRVVTINNTHWPAYRKPGAILVDLRMFDPDDRSANPRLVFRPEKLRELGIPDALIEAAAKSDPQGFLLFDDLPNQTEPATGHAKESTISPRASQRVAWLLDWSRSRIDDSRTGNSLRAGHTRREFTVTGDTGFQFDAEMFIRAGVWLAFHFGRAGL